MNTITRRHSHSTLIASVALLSALVISLSLVYTAALQPAQMRGVEGPTRLSEMAPARSSPGYSLSGYRWQKDTVTFSIANCPQSLDCAAAHAAVAEAAAAWDAAAGISVAQVPENGDIVVSWSTSGYGGRHTFDGQGGTVAQTYYPYTSGALWYDGDIVLDDAEKWVTGGTVAAFPREVHLTSVVMHEFGHALGLAHTRNRAALMWPYYRGVRGLAAADISGIQALYPHVAVAAAQP